MRYSRLPSIDIAQAHICIVGSFEYSVNKFDFADILKDELFNPYVP